MASLVLLVAPVNASASESGAANQMETRQPIGCTPQERMSYSSPEIGAIYGQADALCSHPYAQQVWIHAYMYRDRTPVGEVHHGCVPNGFEPGDYCSAPVMAGTNFEGVQNFWMDIIVDYANEPGAPAQTRSLSVDGAY
ncbi:hypothetical protein [Saccharopolyspora pogona]|uniref:hypothetical protein n=1 Tax=Saccharopolyspora pogona TaxID=333966 RepID=UPI00168913EC|nr:hypothetical protein [Saccharopolyspora pogona]